MESEQSTQVELVNRMIEAMRAVENRQPAVNIFLASVIRFSLNGLTIMCP